MSEGGVAPALVVEGLCKAYRTGFLGRLGQPALKQVSFSVPRGEIFGYLGPNGSGKTTTLKVILGLLFPDSGSVSVLGRAQRDPAWRSEVGFLPEQPYFYDYLTARETLDYMGRLCGMPPRQRRERGTFLLEQVGLARSADVALRGFSKGMIQRFGIAQALVNDPELLFFDEPMSGLDPVGRRQVRDLILELKSRSKTIFFCTHILSDAETLCDRVAVLRGGELLKEGRLDQILEVEVAHMEVMVSGLEEAALPPGLVSRQPVGERWRLEVEEASLGSVIRAAEDAGGRILSALPVRQSLEDYFFKELATGEGDGE
jgi:ABC-2 type transport system ATP-binding protein